MNIKTRVIQEKILLGLSLGGGLGILPFAIYRLSMNQWVIGFMDLIASLAMFLIFFYVFRTRKIRFATMALFLTAITATLLTIYLKGAQQMYWVYPTLVSAFYLLKPKNALIYTSIIIILILPKLYMYNDASIFTFGTMVITLLITISFAYIFSSQSNHQRELLLKQATYDPLTGVGNRRALSEKLNQVIASFQRTANKVTILIIDIDHFKSINDAFGHNAGDRFLLQLTRLLKSRLRITDSLFRFGGDEFIVIAENTDLKAAQILAEELRTTVEKGELITETKVTISTGVAELQNGETDDQWLTKADSALFKAKRSGRNTVCIAED